MAVRESMKILIAGSQGMLGTDLMEKLGLCHQVQGLGRGELDIRDANQCMRRVEDFRPDIVINAAAMTNVDGCELNVEEAFLVNGQGSENLAAAAAAFNSLVVYYSTDYVFDGAKEKPYRESDTPNPQSVYGRSKLRGEEKARAMTQDHLILRTSWLFGCNGKNFIRTIVSAARKREPLRVVDDQKGSPSFTRDLAAHTRIMLERGCRGTYHVTNSGSCSWYELAKQAVQWAGVTDASLIPVTTPEFPRPARRPANSVLANERLDQEGFPRLRPWQEAVQDYIRTCLP
jgi:dTDP-4-dehydrorhamnose reductase